LVHNKWVEMLELSRRFHADGWCRTLEGPTTPIESKDGAKRKTPKTMTIKRMNEKKIDLYGCDAMAATP
jgi:hypothetical protein